MAEIARQALEGDIVDPALWYETTKTTEYSLDVVSVERTTFRTKNGEPEPDLPDFTATVRFDGCVNLYRTYPEDESDTDYIHICDLDEMIALLTELRARATRHFGEGWPR